MKHKLKLYDLENNKLLDVTNLRSIIKSYYILNNIKEKNNYKIYYIGYFNFNFNPLIKIEVNIYDNDLEDLETYLKKVISFLFTIINDFNNKFKVNLNLKIIGNRNLSYEKILICFYFGLEDRGDWIEALEKMYDRMYNKKYKLLIKR